MERYTRRNLGEKAAGFSAAARLASVLPAPQETTPHIELASRASQVFGVHDTAGMNGSQNVDLALFDWTVNLRVKKVVSIEPHIPLLKETEKAGIGIISRLYLPNNQFSGQERRINEVVTRHKEHSREGVQPFNEPREERGMHVPLDTHVREDLVPAAKLITDTHRVKTIITPLAPSDSEFSDAYDMFTALKQSLGPQYVRNNMELGVHPYTSKPGENPWVRIQKYHALAQDVFNGSLPIAALEFGIAPDAAYQFTEDEYAREIVRLLSLDIPKGLDITAVCTWMYADNAQRNDKGNRWEQFAMRKEEGPSKLYRAVERYMQGLPNTDLVR